MWDLANRCTWCSVCWPVVSHHWWRFSNTVTLLQVQRILKLQLWSVIETCQQFIRLSHRDRSRCVDLKMFIDHKTDFVIALVASIAVSVKRRSDVCLSVSRLNTSSPHIHHEAAPDKASVRFFPISQGRYTYSDSWFACLNGERPWIDLLITRGHTRRFWSL